MASRAAYFLAMPAILVLCACSTGPYKATNAPLPVDAPPGMTAAADIAGEHMIALSFSGGGMRAAAFSYGVLETLRSVRTPDGDLLDDVSFITSVSGGSLTAAYFGAFGREGLSRFRQEVLLRDLERQMHTSFLNPMNLIRMLAGSMNADLAATLDREVFKGATFRDILIRGRPDIRINATDLHNQIAFPFIPRLFSIICSDLRSYKVADAVAASMAVPLVFSPVELRTYPDNCQEPIPEAITRLRSDPQASRLVKESAAAVDGYRDLARVHYLRLADGGLTDNYGLSTLLVSRAVIGTPSAPMTPRDAVKIRRALFIIVDAAQKPGGTGDLEENGPTGVDVAMYASAAAVAASARLAADAFRGALKDWQDSVIAFRCGLTRKEALGLGATGAWQCADVRFSLAFLSIDGLDEPYHSRLAAIPTRLTMDVADVDATVEGARAGAMLLPQLQDYLADRNGKGSHDTTGTY